MPGRSKIVHYLDIPIQHCNDGILKAMHRRRIPGRSCMDLADKLRRRASRIWWSAPRLISRPARRGRGGI
ncbi:MAG: hypothetical protein ACLR0P_13070 [Oscillospiraceae bacterium]